MKESFSILRKSYLQIPIIKRRIFYILFFVICLIFFKTSSINSQSAESQYKDALRLLKEKKHDFAFLAFRAIIRDFPETRYAQESQFAIGEYFYEQNSYYEAIRNFADYIKKYPPSNATIFAKAYLMKIMQQIHSPTKKEKELIDKIKMDFFSKPLFLLFSEFKEISYKSPFQNKFTIRYYIDMIEVIKNDKIFLKITQ